MKSFSKWTIEDVEETFNLVLDKHLEELEVWMKPAMLLSEEELELKPLCEKLVDHVWDWNYADNLRLIFL